MKMYIFIKDSVPLGYAINAAAHASVACYAKYKHKAEMQIWFEESFKKVTCKVTEEEFNELKSFPHNIVITESRLGDAELALAFCPQVVWPEIFKTFKLYNAGDDMSHVLNQRIADLEFALDTKTNEGWVCPICKCGVAPSEKMCTCNAYGRGR